LAIAAPRAVPADRVNRSRCGPFIAHRHQG
jgi:hypothetical protein